MGTNLVIRRTTPQAEKVLNVSSSDVGRPINKIKLNIDIPDFERMLVGVIESLHPKTFEIKDKGENWFSVSIRPYRTLDNKIEGVVAILVDITERRKAEQTVEEARAYAENIVETVPVPLIVLDRDYKVISANRAFYQVFKITPQETKGRFIYDLGDRQWNIPKLRQLLEEAIPKSTAVDNYEIEHGFKTIGLKTMLLNARRIYRGTHRTELILLAFEDITERKRAEKRGIELLKQLESANRELSHFAYVVSHDMKAPLRNIGSLANWISNDYSDKLGKEGKDQLELMSGRVKRMNDLIDGVLHYSRLGRAREEKERVNLNRLLKEVIDLLGPPKNIEITLLPKPPVLFFEKAQIQQVFQNLIGNAIKFLDKPKGTIKIDCADTGAYWKFSVQDNGPGIEEKYHQRIFQMFETLGSQGEESTGIGLTIAKRIVEMNEGKIWVESKLGQGSTFFFTVPKNPHLKAGATE